MFYLRPPERVAGADSGAVSVAGLHDVHRNRLASVAAEIPHVNTCIKGNCSGSFVILSTEVPPGGLVGFQENMTDLIDFCGKFNVKL
jgi:hypothetical protein